MRRALRGIAAVAAGLLLTAGCSSDAGSGGAPPTNGIGPITLAIGKDNSGWLQGVITGWNKRFPDQKVTLLLLPQASNDQLAQLVANLQAKSDEYDVIDMDVIWTAEFASNGWIIPLPESQFPLDQFLKPAVDTAMYQGRLYAVPDYSNADLLYYRKDILAKAGMQPPRTWDQLQRLAQIVAPKYGLYGYAGTFAPYEGLTVNFAAAVQSAGGSILSQEGTRVGLIHLRRFAGWSSWSTGSSRAGSPRSRSRTRRSLLRPRSRRASSCSSTTGPTSTRRCRCPARRTRCTGTWALRRCRARTARAPVHSAGPTSRSARSPRTSRPR